MVENKKKEVTHTVVKLNVKNDNFKSYLEKMAFASNNLTNVVIYHCRQWFFYTQNLYYIEKEIKDVKFYIYDSEKIDDLIQHMYVYNQQLLQRNKKPIDFVKYGLDAYFLHYYFKSINQDDYNCKDLSSQTSQQIVKKVTQTFKSFKTSLIDYFKHKEKYKAKPELPRYKKKNSMSGFYFTNQVCTIKNNQIKFPKTKLTLPFTYKYKGRHIRTEVIRKYNEFELNIVFEQKPKPQLRKTNVVAAIDLGVNNLVAITTNKGQSLLVKDKSLKSINQFANKEIARIHSAQTILKPSNKIVSSRQLMKVYQKRDRRIEHFMYCTASIILKFCLENNVYKLVIGKNKDWKQEVKLKKKDKQNFIQIPFNNLISKIKEKASCYGIEVLEQEESYTSKASALDFDKIPVYNEKSADTKFSGRRTKRGLYKTKQGVLINADLNGALNIMRKAFLKIDFETNDLRYLQNPKIIKNIMNSQWVTMG
jgi:transposase, IS605 orfB family